MRFFGLVTLAVGLAGQACASVDLPRFLEQGSSSSAYNMKFGKCMRAKIIEDSDDDGNSYFYNGAYRSQSMAYASFYLCSASSKDSCGQCETTTEYVADLETFLEASVEYVQEYCGQCTNQCRRRLEEEEEAEEEAEEENYYVDCNTCASQCSLLTSGNEGTDESQYIYCQAAFVDDSGNQIYSAPTCGSSYNLVMGLFYDGT
jgi:hypothetical protein